MQFGLMYAAAGEDDLSGDRYNLALTSARFADQNGFSSIWVSGSNPAVLHAALARETRRIGLRAGSVAPLHNLLRVAEEWAVVDNLSGGRVGLSFMSGCQQELFRGIETVDRLWRGESIQVSSGTDEKIQVRVYPRPVQARLPIWVSAAANSNSFVRAGEIGANILTDMLNQGVRQLAENIVRYRQARTRLGYDPDAGEVTVMLYTFVGVDPGERREQGRQSYCEYLKQNALPLLEELGANHGKTFDIAALSAVDRDELTSFLFERFFSTRALFGTPESCRRLVAELDRIGVTEIACLIDFASMSELVLENLKHLRTLKEICASRRPRLRSSTSNGKKWEGPAEIQARCREEIDGPTFYKQLLDRGARLGSSLQGIERLWRRDGEALACVKLPDSLAGEAASDTLHPAFLEACLQVSVSAFPSVGNDGLYLPVGIRRMRRAGPVSQRLWSHAQVRSHPGGASTVLELDVEIFNETGELVTEVTALRLERAGKQNPSAPAVDEEWFYELSWEQRTRAETTANAQPPELWLVLADSTGVGSALAELIQKSENCSVVLMRDSETLLPGLGTMRIDPLDSGGYRRVIEALTRPGEPPLRGIVHLTSLDAVSPEIASPELMEADAMASTGSAVALVQALGAIELANIPRVWFVTRGARAVGPQSSVAIAQAPLWGVGGTCAVERPELRPVLVDLDPEAATSVTATQLFKEIQNAEDQEEDQVAYRSGIRYVLRLARKVGSRGARMRLRPDGSYLITGGLWGFGLEVARWMAQKGARDLVLLGRTQLPSRAEWHGVDPGSRVARQIEGIRQLELAGARVHYASIDVTDEAALTRFLEAFGREHPPIRGVIHAASVWQDRDGETLVRTLARLDPGALREVLRPKMIGGILLAKFFKEIPLDFFAFFSSAASFLGSSGMGNYAAANAFLDALAHYLRCQGRPAVSINWGAISQVGFGATPEGLKLHDNWETRGFLRLRPQESIDRLEELLALEVPQVGVMRIDWDLVRTSFPELAKRPLARTLVGSSREGRRAEPELRLLLEQALPGDRRELLVDHVRGQMMAVMGLRPSKGFDSSRGFFDMGMDSLTALELRNRLQTGLGCTIPATAVFDHPTVYMLVDYLIHEVLRFKAAPAAGPAAGGTNPNQSQAERIARLSEEEVERLFAQKVLNRGPSS